jgi:hypothetical protein
MVVAAQILPAAVRSGPTLGHWLLYRCWTTRWQPRRRWPRQQQQLQQRHYHPCHRPLWHPQQHLSQHLRLLLVMVAMTNSEPEE